MKTMGERGRPKILLCGDTAVSVEFGNHIDPATNRRVQALFRSLKAKQIPGILDLNPTYRSLFIQYDPWNCSFERLSLAVDECLNGSPGLGPMSARRIEIPVCYGEDLGLDIEEVAHLHGLSVERVIHLHCARLYSVYMIGFLPGFPYLGDLDERLRTPRKKEPRKSVAAGSVGIADQQTGIYSIESPGGWQIIGRTPLKLFDLERPDPFYVHVGDRIQFEHITREEFESYQGS